MTQTKDITILVQVLDGSWETVGSDRARGVWPESVTLSADHWGPSKASFSLHRDPGMMWPDIGAFTPVNIEVGGTLVWSGRVEETPVSQSNRVINVQCQGWQYHLDDDVYERAYVRSTPGEWKDGRSFYNSALTTFKASGRVEVGNGVISMIWPLSEQVQNSQYLGAILDMGRSSTAKRVVMTVDWVGAAAGASYALYARAGAEIAQLTTTANDAISALAHAGTTGVAAVGTFPTAGRYVLLFMFYSGVTGAAGYDVGVKIRDIRVFADTAYESGNVSVLKSTTIIPDALNRATMLLSDDRSDIDPTGSVTFAFPEFALDGQKTPRDVLNAANAVHDYMLKVDARRRLIFKPKPSGALIEIGEWPGSSFEDASANSGEEVYNRVVVEGTSWDGEKMAVEWSSVQASGVISEPITSPAPDNGTFAAATTSWTASSGSSITRDTVIFDSTPASGRWDRGAGVTLVTGDTLTETFTGTFRAGITYTLTFWLRLGGTTTSGSVKASFGVYLADMNSRTTTLTSGSPTATVTVPWTPIADQTTVTLTLFKNAHAGVATTAWFYVDSLALSISPRPTLVDKRAFRRTHVLPVKASMTTELATQIAMIWLEAHKTTPLKGSVRVEGDQAVREITTGANVPPELLLLRTGELLRLSDRVDPDTGGQGRNGRIAEVTYSAVENTATVALDSRRTSHEALLERLAVVVGSG